MTTFLWILILLIVAFSVLLVCIFIIYSLWSNQKVNELITPIVHKISNNGISFKNLIQTTTSILAILIAVIKSGSINLLLYAPA